MKKLIVLLLLPLLISGCDAHARPAMYNFQSVSNDFIATPAVTTPAVTDSPPAETEEASTEIYEPEQNLTIEETVEAYFEQQYLSYVTFTDIDLSAIVDMRSTTNQNMVRWLEMLTLRRKLIYEIDFCYVGTEEFPYTILFEEEAEDDRMSVWEKRLEELDATVVHFRIAGEEGEVYPPVMALNAQHSMMFRQVDGVWKIATHYFPGSRRKYGSGTVTVPDEETMLDSLELEFEQVYDIDDDTAEIPAGARVYDAGAAVEYAMKYTEVKNPDFYDIGDWTGNCANFVSQSVWAGFGADRMTGEWYAGSPAWNHVGYFWEYATSGSGLGVQELTSVSELKKGDIIQTRPLSMVDEPDRYTHELIVVEEGTLKLAQNTPAAFVYYSDLVNVQTRMIRPVYLR